MANMIEIILKAIDKASGPIGATTRSLGDLESKAERVHTKLGPLNNLLGTGLKVAAVGAAAGIIALGVGLGSAVMAAADMEQGIADIAAVMGLASDEVEPLAKLIDQLGIDPKLKVDATEAADAIEMLAKNGVTMADIMGGAARNTVLLANATGADFSTAADIATDAMALFDIKAEDMKTAVDGISSVTISSKFDMNDYALALAQAGGVASVVGVEFDDFNAVIAAISPFFASGSDAGTSFKVFLQRLIPQSVAAVDAMRELGLFTGLTKKEFEDAQEKIFKYQNELAMLDPTSKNYAERSAELQQKIAALQSTLVTGSNAFFDSNGNMKDAAQISGILNEALGGLSEEQKNQALSTIFGTDAMRAAAAMAGMTEDEFLALKGTMGKVDAEEQAATRMNTLRGSLEILQGVFDSLKLQIGDKFIPVFKSLVDRLTDFLSEHGPGIVTWAGEMANKLAALIERYLPVFLAKVNEWVNSAPQFVSQFQNAAGQAGELLGKFIEIATPIAKFILEGNNLKAVLIALGAVMAIQAIASVITFVGGIVGAIGAMASFVAGLGLAVPALGAVLAAIGPVIAIAAALGAAVYALWLAWDKNFLGIRDITSEVWEKLKEWFGNIGKWFADFPGTLTSFGTALWEQAKWVIGQLGAGIETAKTAVSTAWDGVKDWLVRAKDEWLPGFGTSLWEGGKALIGKIGEGFTNAREGSKQLLNSALDWIRGARDEKLPGFQDTLFNFGKEALTKIGDGFTHIRDSAKGVLQAALDWVAAGKDGKLGPFQQALFDGGKLAINKLGEGFNNVKEAAKTQLQTVMNDVKEHGYSYATGAAAGRIYDGAKGIIQRFAAGFSENGGTAKADFERILGALPGAFNTMLDGAGGFKNHVFGGAKNIVQRIVDGFQAIDLGHGMGEALGSIVRAFNGVMDGFQTHVWEKMKSIGSDVMGGVAEGIWNGINALDEALRWITNAIPQWIKDKLGIHSPSSVMADLSQWIPPGLAEGIMRTANAPLDALDRVMQDMTAGVAGLAALPGQAMTGGGVTDGAAGGNINYNNQRSNTFNLVMPSASSDAQPVEQVRSLIGQLSATYAS